MKSKQIKEGSSAKEVFEEISRLDKEFRTEFKRSPRVNLVYSSSGLKSSQKHFVSVWYEEDTKSDLDWFILKTK